MTNRYVKYDSVMENIDNGGVLVGNNADWAREAVYKAKQIDLDDYVPVSDIDEFIEYCINCIKVENYHANFGRARVYQDVIEQLTTIKNNCNRGM